MPSRRRLPPPLPLAALALLVIAGCGGGDSTSASVTQTTTVVRTVTAPAATGTTDATTTPTTTTASAPLTLRGAEQVLEGRGYATLTERDWQPDQTLKVLVGIRHAEPRAELAFFFAGDAFIGTDTKDPSGTIEVTSQAADRITLGYRLYEASDALERPTGGTRHVTYVWDGSKLAPEDPIPSADPSAAQSRR